MSPYKKNVFYSAALLLIFLLIELSAYIAMRYLGEKGGVYHPYSVKENEYKEYLNKRDEILGWPSVNQFDVFDGSHYDKSGSRFIPAFPDPDKVVSCISLYGDSYTYGAKVSDEDAWGNILSMLLNCRVSNFGVVAYGTDQAYLRFHKSKNDKSQIVILGYLSENILRNVNQYRPFLYPNVGSEKFALKPRFIIDNGGQLKLVPLPKLNYQGFLQLLEFPEKYLKDEYFIPGGSAGVYKKSFPYTFCLIKVLLRNFHIQAKFRGIPWYTEFYDIKHPSNALGVTFNIIKQFYIDANKLHKKPVILIIPTVLDLEYYIKNKKWTYDSLKRMLLKDKVDFIDAGPSFLEYLGDRQPNVLFVGRYHFNKEGEKVLARIIYAYLKDKAIIVQRRFNDNSVYFPAAIRHNYINKIRL